MNPPQHIAFILDGNGRWAKNKSLPITEGHKAGLENLESILDYCFVKKIKIITLYAFSSENWKRSQQEKEILFDLLLYYFQNKIDKVIQKKSKIKVLGDVKQFPLKIQETIFEAEAKSQMNDDFLLQIALSYGGRDEIIRATKKLIKNADRDNSLVENLNEENFKSYLDSGSIADPDLLIRTGGEMRISNFLLYQIAYTEFFFSKTLWPDFSTDELDKILGYYSRRERRFGGRNGY